MITFDDGHISQYRYALPILQELKMTACFFIVPGWTDQPQFVSWQMIREFSDSGMSCQSHTQSHHFLVQLTSKQLVDELRVSKQELEQRLNKPISFLSLPGGRCERPVWQMASAFGYRGIFTSNPGYGAFRPVWERLDHNQHLPIAFHRFAISHHTTDHQFRSLLNSPFSTAVMQRRGRYFCGSLAKHFLGDHVYDRLWLLKEKTRVSLPIKVKSDVA